MKRILLLIAVVCVAVVTVTAQQVLVNYDFNDGDKSGLSIYDVDNLVPSAFMQSVGFSQGTTWILIKDSNESTDMFVGSTSQYKPAGQANDWLVLPAVDVTSSNMVLEWKSQSFYANLRDGLKVFVSTQGGKPEDFPATPVWEVAEEEIGATEDYFEGEFVSHSLSLADYVGKTIYIAFVNQSYDKSLICVDDIKVSRQDENLSLDVDVAKVVYEQDEITFTGKIKNLQDAPIVSVDMCLKYNDEEYNEILYLDLEAGGSKEFTLSHVAPILLNETLNYSIVASVEGTREAHYVSSVTNTFRHRVVIEDHTGVWCNNCPAGIWALDSLKEVAPDNIVPIAVQNNNGVPNPMLVVDNYDAGLSGAGCMSFPSGWVNRTYIEHPWGSGQYGFEAEDSWISLFDKIMQELPEAGVTVEGYFNEDRSMVQARASVRVAEKKENVDWRVIFVLTEDSVTGFYQSNRYSGMKQWVGGWQNKGSSVSVVFDDIARGIYPSFYGEKGSLPPTINSGEIVEYSYGIAVPYETVLADKSYNVIQNADKLNLIAMVVDGATSRVINADMMRITDAPESVEGVMDDDVQVFTRVENGVVTVTTCAEGVSVATLYAIDGRMLASNSAQSVITLDATDYRGVALVQVVSNGKSVVKKVVVR